QPCSQSGDVTSLTQTMNALVQPEPGDVRGQVRIGAIDASPGHHEVEAMIHPDGLGSRRQKAGVILHRVMPSHTTNEDVAVRQSQFGTQSAPGLVVRMKLVAVESVRDHLRPASQV